MTTKAPAHLAPATRRWFERVTTSDYDLEEHHVRLLTLAAEAWDRGEQARKAIKAEGMTYKDRFGAPKAHPAVAIERDARIAFARLMRELDLDAEAGPDSRIPRRGGR